MKLSDLERDLKAGKISPEDAVAMHELPAKTFNTVTLEDFKVNILDCGFPSLNEFRVFKKDKGELIIVGARPSIGKSAFLFQMASYVAREEYVLVFTLEMDITSIATRLVSQAARVHIQDIQSGECDMSLLQRSLKEISSLKMFIDDRGGLTVEEIVATAINYSKKYKIGLVVVDYLQMVKVDTKKARHEAVANVSLELKNLAKALNCCVVAASQLNRQCESRGKETGDYMPSLSDIRDSGAIEQDADVIVFLSRHEFFEPESCPAHRRGIADISVAKNRNGATGIVHLSWHGSWTKFSDKEINHHGKSKEKNSKEKSYQIVGSKVVGGELTSSVNATTPPIADRDLFDEMLDDNFL